MNNILQRLILDYDKILVVVEMNYNGNILQNPRVYDRKYIFEESNLYYITLSERSRLCELWKTKRTRAHIHTHKCMNTHIHTHASTHTYIHSHAHIRPHAKHMRTYDKHSQATHAHTYRHSYTEHCVVSISPWRIPRERCHSDATAHIYVTLWTDCIAMSLMCCATEPFISFRNIKCLFTNFGGVKNWIFVKKRSVA